RHADLLDVLRVDADIRHTAHGDAAVAHGAVDLEARHRAVKEDVVARQLDLALELADPDDKTEEPDEQRQDERSDGDIAGSRLHALVGLVSRRAAARAVEIFVYPGMVVRQMFFHRPDFDPFIHQDGDTVADRR